MALQINNSSQGMYLNIMWRALNPAFVRHVNPSTWEVEGDICNSSFTVLPASSQIITQGLIMNPESSALA